MKFEIRIEGQVAIFTQPKLIKQVFGVRSITEENKQKAEEFCKTKARKVGTKQVDSVLFSLYEADIVDYLEFYNISKGNIV